MTSEKSVCMFIFLLTLCKGHFFNSTQTEEEGTGLNVTVFEKESSPGLRFTSESTETSSKGTDIPGEQDSLTTGVVSGFNRTGINSSDVHESEIFEIFHGGLNGTGGKDEIAVKSTIMTECVNVTCVEQSWNDTGKTNYTLMAEAVGGPNTEAPAFRLEKSAAIAAGIFLVSAILGYLSCVGYRRFLQRKYGNSQILIAEEVYDTTDLRYFEI